MSTWRVKMRPVGDEEAKWEVLPALTFCKVIEGGALGIEFNNRDSAVRKYVSPDRWMEAEMWPADRTIPDD